MTGVVDPIVGRYAARGFRLVFYPARQKGPNGPDAANWPTRTYAPEDYRDGDNVGVMTGHEIAPGRFLVDVDFDWTDGLRLVRPLLPVTGFGFGRDSRPLSHAFYTTSAPVVSYKFDDIDGSGFVELRGTKIDRTIGFQTMVPPSIHPKGEQVVFREDGEITHDDALPRRVLLYAIACALLKHLGRRGFLQEARLAAAGFLLDAGLSEAEVLAIDSAVADATGNDVGDVATTIRSTAARLRNGDRVTGAGALAKALGDDGKKIVARIREWLDVDDRSLILDPNDPVPSARAFVQAKHTTDDALTLRRQAGVFYAYQPAVAAYHERADATVRADLYAFLETAKTRGRESLLPFRPTRDKVSNILDALNAVTNLDPAIVAPCWLRDDPGLNPLDILACPSGLLHIPTRTLLPATPHFFTSNGLEFDFDPAAPAPANWLAFLDQLWPDDHESIDALQEWFGYALTPDTKFQKIAMVVGPKRSGKGVTGRILRRLVGDRNTCSPTLASFGDQFGKQVLIGKTLAIVADARLGEP